MSFESTRRCFLAHLDPTEIRVALLIHMGPDEIELYLRERLRQRVQVRVGKGYRAEGLLKAKTVH
jgi:hypothetical protein